MALAADTIQVPPEEHKQPEEKPKVPEGYKTVTCKACDACKKKKACVNPSFQARPAKRIKKDKQEVTNKELQETDRKMLENTEAEQVAYENVEQAKKMEEPENVEQSKKMEEPENVEQSKKMEESENVEQSKKMKEPEKLEVS